MEYSSSKRHHQTDQGKETNLGHLDPPLGVRDIIKKIIDCRYVGIFSSYLQIDIGKNVFWNYQKLSISKNVHPV